MTNCEKKLLRELQDLLGTKTVKTTTNNDYQYTLKAGELLTHVIVESDVVTTFKIGTTAGGTQIANDPVSDYEVFSIDQYAKANRVIYFSGYNPDTVTIKLFIQKA